MVLVVCPSYEKKQVMIDSAVSFCDEVWKCAAASPMRTSMQEELLLGAC